MKSSKAAKRYAKALFSSSSEKGTLEAVRNDLQAIRGLAETSEDFKHFITNPLIGSDRAGEVISALFKKKAHPATLQFLQFLAHKKRLNQVAPICAAFDALYDESKNVQRAHVTSTQPLDKRQKEAIKSRLEQRFNKTILIHNTIDPNLIGGFKIQIGDQVLDYSIATQLESFKKKLINA